MALQVWQAGLAAVEWASQYPMPAAYAYTAFVATFAIPHYFPGVPTTPKSAIDLASINTTDIDKIFDQISAEKHGTWVAGTDVRPDILGRIYYDNVVNKKLPESEAKCNRLSEVIDLYLAERETPDWTLRVYEDGVALNCSDWYDRSGWYVKKTVWPDIIDAYLQNEPRRPPGEFDCQRPWSFCQSLHPSWSSEFASGPSRKTTPTPSHPRAKTQVTVSTATTRTVTVIVRGSSLVIHSPGCPYNHNQQFPDHPTKTVPVCSYTTITTTLPEITEVISTVTEVHHLNGTESVPVFIEPATTTGEDGYNCELPTCATSTSIEWQTTTTTILWPKGYRPGTSTRDPPEPAPEDTATVTQSDSSTEAPTTSAGTASNDTSSGDKDKESGQGPKEILDEIPHQTVKDKESGQKSKQIMDETPHQTVKDQEPSSSPTNEDGQPEPSVERKQHRSSYIRRVIASFCTGLMGIGKFFSMLKTVPANMATDIPRAMDKQIHEPEQAFLDIIDVVRAEPEAVVLATLATMLFGSFLWWIRGGGFRRLGKKARPFWNRYRREWLSWVDVLTA